MKKIYLISFITFLVTFLFSCKQKKDYGDFTIITEKDKYEVLGGALKIDGHSLEYKGNKIDWSSIIGYSEDSNIEEFEYLNSTDKIETNSLNLQQII